MDLVGVMVAFGLCGVIIVMPCILIFDRIMSWYRKYRPTKEMSRRQRWEYICEELARLDLMKKNKIPPASQASLEKRLRILREAHLQLRPKDYIYFRNHEVNPEVIELEAKIDALMRETGI